MSEGMSGCPEAASRLSGACRIRLWGRKEGAMRLWFRVRTALRVGVWAFGRPEFAREVVVRGVSEVYAAREGADRVPAGLRLVA